jgi:hypothetical protein
LRRAYARSTPKIENCLSKNEKNFNRLKMRFLIPGRLNGKGMGEIGVDTPKSPKGDFYSQQTPTPTLL